jgi:hypothetical protein
MSRLSDWYLRRNRKTSQEEDRMTVAAGRLAVTGFLDRGSK